MTIPPPASPGGPFAYPASFYNLQREMGAEFLDRKGKGLSPTASVNPGEVRIENATGGVLSVGDVVALGAPVDDPAGDSAATRPTISASVASSSSVLSFGVVVSPCANGDSGRAAVSGVVVCTIDVGDESHGFAQAQASSKKLASAHYGPARILWKQDPGDRAVSGVAVAVVLLGVADQPSIVWGKITARSVSVDSPGSSITYSASGGGLSVTGATPLFRSTASDIELTPAAVDSLCAIGWIDGAAALLWAREIMPGDECAT